MTFPCKEEFIQFEQLEARQRQIYPDAADAGIPLAEVDAPALRHALNEMLKVFKKPEYDYDAQQWGNGRTGGRSVEFFIPIEYDGNQTAGYKFRVAFCADNKINGGGFISIDILRQTRPRKVQ